MPSAVSIADARDLRRSATQNTYQTLPSPAPSLSFRPAVRRGRRAFRGPLARLFVSLWFSSLLPVFPFCLIVPDQTDQEVMIARPGAIVAAVYFS